MSSGNGGTALLSSMIKPVTKNNMVFLAKAMLLQQKEF